MEVTDAMKKTGIILVAALLLLRHLLVALVVEAQVQMIRLL